jgi:transglutaminase-like putative cysteine protease
MGERTTTRVAGLGWVLAALGVACIAHAKYLPPWVSLLVLVIGAWRWRVDSRGWPMVPKWPRVLVTLLATLAVLGTYRTLNGIEAGTTFLVLMAGMKLLESKNTRDLTVVVFIAYFLLFAALLRDQQLLQLPLLVASVLLTTAALMSVHAGQTGDTPRALLRQTSLLIAQTLPLALMLFLLFPRLPGPLWGFASESSARSGLNDEMTPGDVSELSISGDPAFRVRFDGPLPPPEQRYWRGPVLQDFDGRSWRRSRAQAFPAQRAHFTGEPLNYPITLEPHDRRWVLALDLPAEWPDRTVYRIYDFQRVSARPITEVSSFRLKSFPVYVAGDSLPASLRRKNTQLPPESNPRIRQLGQSLARQYGEPRAVVQAMLHMFREQPFEYTLRPPKLTDNAMDEFLFETRLGFCEHYASAFTLVMRAAGIPARVVTGYQGGDFNPVGGYLLVRQSDAHAWSEVWMTGQGWVRVDPTAAVAPERIQRGLIGALAADEPAPGRLRSSSALWLRVELTWDALNDFWNERIVRFNSVRQMDLLERLGLHDPDWRTLGFGLAASLAAFFVTFSAYLAWKFREPPLDWPARLHREATRRLKKRNIEPGPAEGPVAFLDRAITEHPDLSAQIRDIRSLYVALRYGPHPREDQLRRLKHAVNRLQP